MHSAPVLVVLKCQIIVFMSVITLSNCMKGVICFPHLCYANESTSMTPGLSCNSEQHSQTDWPKTCLSR